MNSKNELHDYELRKEASEMQMSPEELRKLKNLIRRSEEERTTKFDKNQK